MKESRRHFLRRGPQRIAVISATVSALASTGCERPNTIIEATNLRNAQPEPSLAESAFHGFALSGFNYLTTRLAARFNLPLGNAYAVKEMENKQLSLKEELAAVAAAVTVGPAVEEWLFRLYPSRMWASQDNSTRWDVGAASSLAYALFHNLNITRAITKKEPPVLTDRLPVPQFVSGLFLWHNFRKNEAINNQGFLHSTIMHSASNLGVYLIHKGTQAVTSR